jgi:hypothetical protein
MLLILQSIAPLVVIIAAGFTAGKSGLLTGTFRKALSDFCFYFGMPALLIRTIATAPPSETAAHLVWGGYLIPAMLVWIAATIYAQLCGRSATEAASLAMASTYGNVIMLGIPLTLAQFGPAAATTVAFVVLVHSPVLFLVASLHYGLAEMRRPLEISPATATALLQSGDSLSSLEGRGQLYRAVRETSRDLVTNPVIIAILIGFCLRVSEVGLDQISGGALLLLGQATLPCVLVAMGLSLSSFELKGEIGAIAVVSLLKLVAMPALAWFVSARLLELPAADVAVITLLSAMPTGANAYAFASRVDAGEASVSGAVALSTVGSILTIALVISSLATPPA